MSPIPVVPSGAAPNGTGPFLASFFPGYAGFTFSPINKENNRLFTLVFTWGRVGTDPNNRLEPGDRLGIFATNGTVEGTRDLVELESSRSQVGYLWFGLFGEFSVLYAKRRAYFCLAR